jgi:hypothetical protein
VHVQSFNDNLKELGVVESKRGAIRKGLVHELLYAQDTTLASQIVPSFVRAAVWQARCVCVPTMPSSEPTLLLTVYCAQVLIINSG